MDLVPTINISDPALKEAGSKQLTALDHACRDHGFFLLTGHGLDQVFDRMWSEAAAFFAAPRDERLAILRTEERPLGYYDRELTKQKRDLKEVFDFMRPAADRKGRNQWPTGRPHFEAAMNDFYEAMSGLAADTLDLVQTALGLPESDRINGDPSTSNVRLNHYPVGDPLTTEERSAVNGLGDMALHHHTDPGLITLLLQDSTGGLQALSRANGWIDVPPERHAVIVNIGDAMQAFSNDEYRAAVHRVTPMNNADRMSTPYFFNPPADATIAPHPVLASTGARYRPFAWREFIQARIDDNFKDLGAEDTQVDVYRVN
ncbi:MAG: 2OG-Fe(II) oxygenase family protein [Pseudomonadota bacterium]